MRRWRDWLLSYDSRISARFSQWVGRHRITYLFSAALAHSGDGLLITLLGIIAYAIGGDDVRALLIQLLITLVALAALVAASKYAIRRERPDGIDSAKWSSLPKYDRYSFPSGHAARVSAVALVLATAFPAIAWPVVIWATAVSLARVAVGAHHLIDIVGGSICGLLVTIIVQTIIAAL